MYASVSGLRPTCWAGLLLWLLVHLQCSLTSSTQQVAQNQQSAHSSVQHSVQSTVVLLAGLCVRAKFCFWCVFSLFVFFFCFSSAIVLTPSKSARLFYPEGMFPIFSSRGGVSLCSSTTLVRPYCRLTFAPRPIPSPYHAKCCVRGRWSVGNAKKGAEEPDPDQELREQKAKESLDRLHHLQDIAMEVSKGVAVGGVGLWSFVRRRAVEW